MWRKELIRQNIDRQTGGVWYSTPNPRGHYGQQYPSGTVYTFTSSLCLRLHTDRTPSPRWQVANGHRTGFDLQHGAHPASGARSLGEKTQQAFRQSASI